MAKLNNKALLEILFAGYQKIKENRNLYGNTDIPLFIIDNYIHLIEKPAFSDLITRYKKMYIYNESRVEANFTKEEQAGLSEVYDYLQSYDYSKKDFNVFIEAMTIHHKLYSKCGDGSFGGHLRESTAVLQDLNVEVLPPLEAMKIFNSYIARGDFLKKYYEQKKIFKYIDECIKLNVELIKLQPFADGNKRTARALLNLLLKRINIPPVYIDESEYGEYKKVLIKALNATSEKDYNDIIHFYYYKLCDAIMTLDINNSELSKKTHKTK